MCAPSPKRAPGQIRYGCRNNFAILHTPFQSSVSFLTVCLYSLLASRLITLFFLLYTTLYLIQLGTNREAFYVQEACRVSFTTSVHSSNHALEACGEGRALGTVFAIVFLIAQCIASASTSRLSLVLYGRLYRGCSRPSSSLYTTFQLAFFYSGLLGSRGPSGASASTSVVIGKWSDPVCQRSCL